MKVVRRAGGQRWCKNQDCLLSLYLRFARSNAGAGRSGFETAGPDPRQISHCLRMFLALPEAHRPGYWTQPVNGGKPSRLSSGFDGSGSADVIAVLKAVVPDVVDPLVAAVRVVSLRA